MRKLVFIFCYVLVLIINETRGGMLTSQSEVLRKLFNDIDIIQNVRPPGQKNPDIKFFDASANVTGDPVIVNVNFHVLDVTNVDDVNQEFTMTLYLRQNWNDPRLRYSSSEPGLEFVLISDPSRIWVPDLFVINEKRARIGDVTRRNAMIRIKKNGDVFYSTRLAVTLSCRMDHSRFPLDKQKCSINLESYAYQMQDLIVIWTEPTPITISKKLTTKPFELKAFGYDYCNSRLTTGDYSCVRAELLLVRRGTSRYILQVYVPLGALVLLSYALLWCPGHRCSKLSAAGVLFVLVAIVAALVTGLAPRTGDCTAIDCWAWWSVFLSALPLFAMTISAMLETCCTPQQDIQAIAIVNSTANNMKEEIVGMGNKTEAAQKLNSDTEVGTPVTSHNNSWFAWLSCIPGSRIEQLAALILPLIFLLIVLAYVFQFIDLIGIRALSTLKKIPY